MVNISKYLNARKIAVIIALVVLVLGSVMYFSTNVAVRNNEMMYKEIYGENAAFRNGYDINDDINRSGVTQSTKTELV